MPGITIGVFVDTNVFLHFRDLSQLDLHKILSCSAKDEIRVLLPLVVVKELDEHKELHRKEKIRERAKNALQRIEKWEIDGKVQNFVKLEVLMQDSYEAGTLNDDLTMSAVVEFRKTLPSMRIVVLSGDTAVRLRAKALGLEYVRLPEEARLPSIPSEDQKIIEENKRLKNRLPLLELTYADRKTSLEWPISLADYEGDEPLPLETIQARCPLLTTSEFVPLFTMLPGMTVDKWNTRIREYYNQYAAYLKAHKAWQNRRSNFLTMQLYLWNVGDGPARDIDVTVLFPTERIRIHLSSKLPQAPEIPDEPKLNTVFLPDPVSGLGIALGNQPAFPSLRPKSNVEGPEVVHYDDGMTGADYKIGRIKQSDGVIIPEFVLEYLGDKSRNETIEILTHSEEMTFERKESTLKLNVVLK